MKTTQHIGKLCVKGHAHEDTGGSVRNASGNCVMCAREGLRRWQQKNPERVKEHAAKYGNANREKKAATARAWRAKPENLERERARKRAAYKADPEKRKAEKKAYYEANKDAILAKNRMTRLLREYGISAEEYDSRHAAQEGCCACCGKREEDALNERLCVDHCHETGRIRGLICNRCNVGIGKLGDTEQGLLNAINYLRKSKQHERF